MTIFPLTVPARLGRWLSVALAALLWQPVAALDMRNLDLISPINGQRFPVVSVPPRFVAVTVVAVRVVTPDIAPLIVPPVNASFNASAVST